MTKSWATGFAVLALVTACDNEEGSGDGYETGACVMDLCFGDLECLSGVCVNPDGAGSGDGDGDDSGDSGENLSSSTGDGDGDTYGGSGGDGDGDGDTYGGSGGDGDGDGDSSGDGDGDGDGTSSSSGDGDGDGDPPGPDDDPEYPRPVDTSCAGPFALLQGLNVCLPPCSGQTCPSADTGTASPGCVYNPMNGGATECTVDADCEDMAGGQTCQENAGGGMTCLYPSTHCVLFCSVAAANCPDAMRCISLTAGSDEGFCEYGP